MRWTLHDPVAGDTWAMPINPNTMTTLVATKKFDTTAGTGADGRVRTLAEPIAPFEWSFGGVIRAQDQYDALADWCTRPNPIELSDHFGRTWLVLLEAFDPDEKRPTLRTAWRFDYTVRAHVLGRLA